MLEPLVAPLSISFSLTLDSRTVAPPTLDLHSDKYKQKIAAGFNICRGKIQNKRSSLQKLLHPPLCLFLFYLIVHILVGFNYLPCFVVFQPIFFFFFFFCIFKVHPFSQFESVIVIHLQGKTVVIKVGPFTFPNKSL